MTPLGASIALSGDSALLHVGSQTFEIPSTSLNMSGGKVWVEMAVDMTLDLDRDAVSVVEVHPEPTLEQVLTYVDTCNPEIVAGLMAQESSWGSLEDSIGLVALRAVSRAIQGQIPEMVDDMGGLE